MKAIKILVVTMAFAFIAFVLTCSVWETINKFKRQEWLESSVISDNTGRLWWELGTGNW